MVINIASQEELELIDVSAKKEVVEGKRPLGLILLYYS
jgi:hypothetical protein